MTYENCADLKEQSDQGLHYLHYLPLHYAVQATAFLKQHLSQNIKD